MMLQRVPAGWTPEQVAALDDLAAAVAAYQLVLAADGIVQDGTTNGTAVRRDVRALVQESWARVCSYQSPPDVPA